MASVAFVLLVGLTTLVAEWWAMILLCGMVAAGLHHFAHPGD
jgi:hypothetical protein